MSEQKETRDSRKRDLSSSESDSEQQEGVHVARAHRFAQNANQHSKEDEAGPSGIEKIENSSSKMPSKKIKQVVSELQVLSRQNDLIVPSSIPPTPTIAGWTPPINEITKEEMEKHLAKQLQAERRRRIIPLSKLSGNPLNIQERGRRRSSSESEIWGQESHDIVIRWRATVIKLQVVRPQVREVVLKPSEPEDVDTSSPEDGDTSSPGDGDTSSTSESD